MNTRMVTRLSLWLFVGFMLSTTAAALVPMYRESQRLAYESERFKTGVVGLDRYETYITVQSFDADTNTLVASVRSWAANQDLLMRLPLADTLTITRRDALIRDGVIVGTQPPVPASFDDLTPGMHGIAVVRNSEKDGLPIVESIVIGNPFPRP